LVRILAVGILFLVAVIAPTNFAQASRFTSFESTSGFVNPHQQFLSVGFGSKSAGFPPAQLIPNVKVVWYVFNNTSSPTITSPLIITHDGNYSIEGVVVLNIISFDTRTNSTGWATLNFAVVTPCFLTSPPPFGYLINGSVYSDISHLPNDGFCP
jgi:hypothetical protein